jgi:hypothetical protein
MSAIGVGPDLLSRAAKVLVSLAPLTIRRREERLSFFDLGQMPRRKAIERRCAEFLEL